MSLQSWIEGIWYRDAAPPTLLRPLSSLFGVLAERRRKRQQADAVSIGCPVIVVGNITVGGTGKTPLVIWLVERLIEWGFRPGVISRGYGGKAEQYPWRVNVAESTAGEVGDEPLMIARRTGVPVIVGPDRCASARQMLEGGEVDLIVSDDGLQHYALARDLEICVVDGVRGFGNGALLPAGPLREPVSRLDQVPLLVVNGSANADIPNHAGRIDVRLRPSKKLCALGGESDLALESLSGKKVHAVAGIGNPERFFGLLEAHGMAVIRHPFPDHHPFKKSDLLFDDELPVLMTEKDAIKCLGFSLFRHYYLPVDLEISESDSRRVQQCCDRFKA